MNSYVLRINIDPTTKIATGVQFKKNGIIYNIGATKEVILSAGAINSPQILMLSGVGPEDHLKSLGIPVIADLRVGDNLQDHVSLGGMVFTINKVLILFQFGKKANVPRIKTWFYWYKHSPMRL